MSCAGKKITKRPILYPHNLLNFRKGIEYGLYLPRALLVRATPKQRHKPKQAEARKKAAPISKEMKAFPAQLLPTGRQEKLQQDLCGHQLSIISSRGTAAIRAPSCKNCEMLMDEWVRVRHPPESLWQNLDKHAVNQPDASKFWLWLAPIFTDKCKTVMLPHQITAQLSSCSTAPKPSAHFLLQQLLQ